MAEIKEVKRTKKVANKPKKIAEPKVEKAEEVVEEVFERKTYRQLRNELRGLKDHIEVEIVNLNAGETYYRDKDGREVFRLSKPSDREYITLADVYDIANRHTGYFSQHIIAITDVISDEYDLEDILEYLNLKEIYDEIERYDTDYIDHILNKLDVNKFERVVDGADIKLVNSLASRAVKLYREKKFDSRLKEEILAKRLNRDSLFM